MTSKNRELFLVTQQFLKKMTLPKFLDLIKPFCTAREYSTSRSCKNSFRISLKMKRVLSDDTKDYIQAILGTASM
jgi:hypothetical protein